MRLLLLIGLSLVATVIAQNGELLPELEGMQSLVVSVDTSEKLELVRSYRDVPGFDFVRSSHDALELLVAAEHVELFKKFLAAHDIPYFVADENVKERLIEDYIAQQVERRMQILLRKGSPSGKLSFTYYPEYDEIVSYLEYIAGSYSDVAKLINIGQSSEGRDLKGLKISGSGKNKPAIFIDAGIHAREWIAPATALYIIDQLVANQTNRHLLESIDWYIVPLLNPDGYQFTHSKIGSRLWRKTRSGQPGAACRGVDGNRNFDMEWMTIGASSNPCSDTYAGPKPASEPETQAVQNFILSQKGNIKIYLTLHSYGQYILYPWGYTTKLPTNELQLRMLANECAKAIESVRNTRYTFGTSANHLYPSSGGSDDWAMDKGGADLAYTYELPGGRYGFVLPPTEIIPVGVETFEAIKAVEKYARSKYV